MRRLGSVLAAAGLLLGLAAAPVRAAGPEVLDGSASATFNEKLEFRADIRIDGPLKRAEILLDFPTAIGPFVREVPVPAGTGRQELVFRWSFAADGHLVPNTKLAARWRLTPADGSAPVTGGLTRLTYADDRFDWKTLGGSLVRLHWYQGSDAFARRALQIGEQGVKRAQDLLSVTETDPVDFFIYATTADFYDAMGPGTRENVGGTAHPDIRTLFANIGPGAVDDPWVATVVPHELTHLVFATAVDNPYHDPPRWLNEGLAQYLSVGYQASDRSQVEDAVARGTIIPLTALGGLFPTTSDGFFLAYAESVGAMDFLVATYGKGDLVKLIRSYAAGVTDDEAFRSALGVDVAGFQAAWFAKIEAKMPPQSGPQPDAPGPVPPGWEGDGAAASPTPGPVATPTAVTSASPPAATATPTSVPGESGQGSSGGLLVLGLGAIGTVVVLVAVLALRMRRPAEPGPPG